MLSPKLDEMETKPGRIFAQYSCSLPQRKDLGSAILLVLVANLVVLRLMWTLLNWAATKRLQKKDPDANFCLGSLTVAADRTGTRYEKDSQVTSEPETPMASSRPILRKPFPVISAVSATSLTPLTLAFESEAPKRPPISQERV